MFSKIHDVANFDIIITRHDESGLYNITTALPQFYRLYPSTRIVKPEQWLYNICLPSLAETVFKRYGRCEMVIRDQGEHNGLYIHAALYRSMLSWLSDEYVVEVFANIDIIQNEYVRMIEDSDIAHDLEQMLLD